MADPSNPRRGADPWNPAGRALRWARAVLVVVGFACLTAAAWTLHTAAGLAAAGAACLLLEALTGDRPSADERPDGAAR